MLARTGHAASSARENPGSLRTRMVIARPVPQSRRRCASVTRSRHSPWQGAFAMTKGTCCARTRQSQSHSAGRSGDRYKIRQTEDQHG